MMIMKNAVSFEYEWMTDGTLRLRFLTEADDIVGQAIVDQKALTTLQLLISFAVAKHMEMPAKQLRSMYKKLDIKMKLSEAEFMLKARRVRAGTTPEGGSEMKVVEE
jgi:hypothetical protein